MDAGGRSGWRRWMWGWRSISQVYHPPFCTFVLNLSVLFFLCQTFICCFYGLVFSKPLKKLGNSFFLLQSRMYVSFFHLRLIVLLIFSSSNWNTLWKAVADDHMAFFLYLSFHSYFVCRFVHSCSVWCLVFPVFVAIWFLLASICVLVASVPMMLPSASETSSEAPSETSFAIPHLHPLLFFPPVEILMFFRPNDHLALKQNERTDQLVNWKEPFEGCFRAQHVEHEQVTHLKARNRLRWRRTSWPLFPGDMTVDVNFSGSLRAWKLWTSWNK